MATKEYFTLRGSLELESIHQMQFSIKLREGAVYSFAGGIQSVCFKLHQQGSLMCVSLKKNPCISTIYFTQYYTYIFSSLMVMWLLLTCTGRTNWVYVIKTMHIDSPGLDSVEFWATKQTFFFRVTLLAHICEWKLEKYPKQMRCLKKKNLIWPETVADGSIQCDYYFQNKNKIRKRNG